MPSAMLPVGVPSVIAAGVIFVIVLVAESCVVPAVPAGS